MNDDSRLIAKRIISQWENHDKFRIPAGESKKKPDQVIVAEALLRVDAEYGCEVRDPAGTIWQHAANLEALLIQLRIELAAIKTKLAPSPVSTINHHTELAEVERLRAELATIKSEGIPPVTPNSMWTDDSGRLVVYCKTTHNAMQLQEWLHERIKIT